jgi:hypothetical protein
MARKLKLPKPRIVCVCGGRDYTDHKRLKKILDKEHELRPMDLLTNGGASGADTLSSQWASIAGVHCATIRALWQHSADAAGPIRNSMILKCLKVSKLIAFPGGKGTADMVKKAERLDIRILRVKA